MLMTGKELLDVHSRIKKRRVLGYKSIMPYGGSRHSIQGFLIFARPDVVVWHRFSDTQIEATLSHAVHEQLVTQLRRKAPLTALSSLNDLLDEDDLKTLFLRSSCSVPITFKGSSDERELSLAFLQALTPTSHSRSE